MGLLPLNLVCFLVFLSVGYSFSPVKSFLQITSSKNSIQFGGHSQQQLQPQQLAYLFPHSSFSRVIGATTNDDYDGCDGVNNMILPSKKIESNNNNIFSFFHRIPLIIRLLFSSLTTMFLFGRRVFAKGFSNKSSGWDLYGRVPYDDWLFSTWALSDPNLLKRSFVEAVSLYIRIFIYH